MSRNGMAPFALRLGPTPIAMTGSRKPLPAPTISGTPVITGTTASPGGSTSAAIAFDLSNQPTDGSLLRPAMWYRPTGSTPWAILGQIQPVRVVNGIAGYSDVNATNLLNGVGYDFGVSYVGISGYESDITLIGSITAAALAFKTSALSGGAATAPTLSSGPTFSQTNSNEGISSDILLTMTVDNQPTDGSLYALAVYYGTSGGSLRRQVLTVQPGASATYTNIPFPASLNGTTYGFALAFVYTNNTESNQLALGTYATIAVATTFMNANIPNSAAFVTDATIEFSWTGTGPYAVNIWYDNGTAATDATVIQGNGTSINLGHTTSGSPSYNETGVAGGTNYYAVLSRAANGTVTLNVQKTPFTLAQFATFYADGGIVAAAAQGKTPLLTTSGSGGSGGHAGGGGGRNTN